MSDKFEITLEGVTYNIPKRTVNGVNYYHAATMHKIAQGTRQNDPQEFMRKDSTRSLVIECKTGKDNDTAIGLELDQDKTEAEEGAVSYTIYEQDKTEAEEGAVSFTIYEQDKTEAEEGAVSFTNVVRNKMDSLILKDKKGGEYNVVNSTQKSEYLSATHMQRLPAELEEGLVFTPSRKEGMYFNETLMLKYAQYLSSKIEKVCLDKLNEIRRFEQLPAEKQADIYIDKATEKLKEDLQPKQSAEKRLDTKVKTKYLFSVLQSMLPKDEDLKPWYTLMNGRTNQLFKHTAKEIKALADGSKPTRDYMTDTCIRAIELVEGFVCSDLVGMRSAGVKLTEALLIQSVNEAIARVEPSLFKWTDEIDFLVNENKVTKILTEVTLKSDYSTTRQVTNLKQLT